VSGLGSFCLKNIIDLIFYKRLHLSEQCFWTLNNFLIADKSLAPALINSGLCKAIVTSLDQIKAKSPEFLSEIFWTLNYLMDFDEHTVLEVFTQIPNLVVKLT